MGTLLLNLIHSWLSRNYPQNNPPLHTLTVTKATDIGGTFLSYSNNVVMALSIDDNYGDTLKGLRIGNAGTLAALDIPGVKLWYDNPMGTNDLNQWGPNDIYVGSLFWNGSIWTNDNIIFGTNLSIPKIFLVTIGPLFLFWTSHSNENNIRFKGIYFVNYDLIVLIS